jgi:ribonuclease P protein component
MRFRPEQHLRRQDDIRLVRERGRRIDGGAFVVWVLRRTDPLNPPPRAGFVASRAAVGGAVARNRAKRRLRELFRRNQAALSANLDLLFVARSGMVRASFPDLERAFAAARAACVSLR